MQLNPNPILRKSRLPDVIDFKGRESGEIVVNPTGGLFDKKSLAAALRHLGPGKRILLGEGEHSSPEITRTASIRGTSSKTVLKGPVKTKSARVIMEGLEIEAPRGEVALEIRGGTVFLEGCTIRGGITVEKEGVLFLRNCLLSGADEGIALVEDSQVEVHASRLTDCRIGVSLGEKASGAFYHCRIDHCVAKDDSELGAGIFAKEADLYCEAVTFAQNGVGVFLKNTRNVRLLCSHFYAQGAAAVIAESGPEGHIKMRSCVVEKQSSARSAQVSVTGGMLSLAHSTIRPISGTGLFVNQARLEIADSRVAAEEEAAFEARDCEFSAKAMRCESTKAVALSAQGCRGVIQGSGFLGAPPTQLENCPELSLVDCRLQDLRSASPEDAHLPMGPETPHFIKKLSATIYQDTVRAEMERILRLAHAARQRELSGRPMHEQNFHVAFAGSPGSGKLAAAKILAEGLCTFGITAKPEVEELHLAGLPGFSQNGHSEPHLEKLKEGVILISANDATSLTKDIRETQKALEKMVQSPRSILILDGDREQLRTLLRLSPILERAFRHFLYFPEYGPRELMTVFAQLCAKDHITFSPDAAVCGLLLFHAYCDRKDKLFSTVAGVEDIYHAAREHYLERCSRVGRFDLDLAKEDLQIPQDRGLQKAIERSPAFVSFCPTCSQENPWIPGLEEKMICLHCGHTYEAKWGLWNESASYRRAKEPLAGTLTGPRRQRAALS